MVGAVRIDVGAGRPYDEVSRFAMKIMRMKMVSLVLVCVFPAVASGQTAVQIVGRALTARGGVAKILAVKSERVTGTISFGEDATGPFTVKLARPMKMSMALTLQGQNMIRVYDGKSAGWANNPFAGKTDVEDMTADELKNIADEADFDGPFVDAKRKGNRFELAGKDKVGDQEAWRIKLITKNGDVKYYSFDTKTYLLLRWEGERRYKGQFIPTQSFFEDYRDVGGLKFAFKIDSGTSLSNLTQKLLIDEVELNPDFEESEFAKPTAPPAGVPTPSGEIPGAAPSRPEAPASTPPPSPTPH
jgi:outer membrane lipoprotein-sorting protein